MIHLLFLGINFWVGLNWTEVLMVVVVVVGGGGGGGW